MHQAELSFEIARAALIEGIATETAITDLAVIAPYDELRRILGDDNATCLGLAVLWYKKDVMTGQGAHLMTTSQSDAEKDFAVTS